MPACRRGRVDAEPVAICRLKRGSVPDVHERSRTSPAPLNEEPFDVLCPGADALDALQDAYR